MKQYEDKYLVINRKKLDELSPIAQGAFDCILKSMNVSTNKYYVVKQSESYADRVLKLILEEK